MALPAWLKAFKNNVIFVAVSCLILLLRALPEGAAQSLMAALGRLGYFVARGERRKTMRHLRQVYGEKKSASELRELGKAVFENLGKSACTAIRTKYYLELGIEKFVQVEGLENLDRELEKGCGVLGITGHIGCWELLAAYLARRGCPLAVVGRKLYDPRLDRILVGWREEAGLVNLPREGAARRMLKWLREGKMIGVLIDQDTGVESEFVDFMGRPAKTPIAPMLLAQKAGAAIVPMAIRLQRDGRHFVRICPALELLPDDGTRPVRRQNLEKCSKAVERFILEAPDQWVWMHERWKSSPLERQGKPCDA